MLLFTIFGQLDLDVYFVTMTSNLSNDLEHCLSTQDYVLFNMNIFKIESVLVAILYFLF